MSKAPSRTVGSLQLNKKNELWAATHMLASLELAVCFTRSRSRSLPVSAAPCSGSERRAERHDGRGLRVGRSRCLRHRKLVVRHRVVAWSRGPWCVWRAAQLTI